MKLVNSISVLFEKQKSNTQYERLANNGYIYKWLVPILKRIKEG